MDLKLETRIVYFDKYLLYLTLNDGLKVKYWHCHFYPVIGFFRWFFFPLVKPSWLIQHTNDNNRKHFVAFLMCVSWKYFCYLNQLNVYFIWWYRNRSPTKNPFLKLFNFERFVLHSVDCPCCRFFNEFHVFINIQSPTRTIKKSKRIGNLLQTNQFCNFFSNDLHYLGSTNRIIRLNQFVFPW